MQDASRTTALALPDGMGRLWRIAALLLALCAPSPAAAQAAAQPSRDSAVKAAFLHKFAGYVGWPAGLFKRPDEPLVIGAWGDDELAADLERLTAGKNVEGRPLATRRVQDEGAATGVHILFLAERPVAQLRETIAAVPGPVLIVTDQEGALQEGSIINFARVGGRVRFAVSLPAAEARGIRLSSRLLAVAQLVERRRR